MDGPIVHNIVSNVDTIIFLKNPCTEFAKWEQRAPAIAEPVESIVREGKSSLGKIESAAQQYSMEKKKGKKNKKKGRTTENPLIYNEGSVAEIAMTSGNGRPSTSSTVPEVSLKSTQHSIFGATPSKASDLEENDDNNGSSQQMELDVQEPEQAPQVIRGPGDEEGIRFRVCAGNLMSASPWFNRMLTRDGWKESNRNQEDNCYHIDAKNWDEEAFVILMNIFHLRHRSVPRTVTLDMLAKIAVLANYYECVEAIQLFVDIWTADLKARTTIPQTYCRNLILWILVSWVFSMSELFKQTTLFAIKQCDKRFQDLGLPIPERITEEIDLRRFQAIESVISSLYMQLDVYRSATYSCPGGDEFSFRCGCILYGSLTKRMDSANLMPPSRPEIPFWGLSFDSICDKILSMKSESWYDGRRYDRYGYGDNYNLHDCNLTTTLESIVDPVRASREGLSLREKSAQN